MAAIRVELLSLSRVQHVWLSPNNEGAELFHKYQGFIMVLS